MEHAVSRGCPRVPSTARRFDTRSFISPARPIYVKHYSSETETTVRRSTSTCADPRYR